MVDIPRLLYVRGFDGRGVFVESAVWVVFFGLGFLALVGGGLLLLRVRDGVEDAVEGV